MIKNRKIITGVMLLLFAFWGKAQETLIVSGYLKGPSISNKEISMNFHKNMFCYLKGDFVMHTYSSFCKFKVDSVINGSFQNFNNEINKSPFYINFALINESLTLNYGQKYTLEIKQFPNTNFYYADNLNQVPTNERHLYYLTEYNKICQNFQQNIDIDILTKRTLQERHDFLNKTQKNGYGYVDYTDYRYIHYILPFMTSKDSITNYYELHAHSIDKETGQVVETIWWTKEEKELYSDFLYSYLKKLLFFKLPDKMTDSIGWHQWYDSLFSNDCFPFVKYAQSEHKTITTTNNSLSFFLTDIHKRKIYFKSARKAYVYDMKTEKLLENQLSEHCIYPYIENNYSIQNNEIAKYTGLYRNNFFKKGIGLYTLTNNAFCCQQEKIIPLEYVDDNSLRDFIIHNKNDFFVFWVDRDDYNWLKTGKIDRKGKWIIKPKNLYEKTLKGSLTDIGEISFCQSNKNEMIFAFSDRTYEKYTDAIIVYKINANLEVKDSVVFKMDFLSFDYHFAKTHLFKKDKTYLLLAEVAHNNGNQLYYRLLNEDLTPKTDFIKLSNYSNSRLIAKPILTAEGFMISWVDNDLSENVVRSVLIDKSGKQSKIINITNQKIDNIYNVEFDKNNVDIYLYNQDEKMLIRKRINKKEYGL